MSTGRARGRTRVGGSRGDPRLTQLTAVGLIVAMRSSRLDEVLAPFLATLKDELRRQAWEMVQTIVEAEWQRRTLITETVARAFDNVLGNSVTTADESPSSTSPAKATLAHEAKEAPPVTAAPTSTRPAAAGEEQPITGNVKWFNETKGFGFIVGPDGEDVFVHYKHILGSGYRELEEGEPVRYRLNHGPRGSFASHVRPLAR